LRVQGRHSVKFQLLFAVFLAACLSGDDGGNDPALSHIYLSFRSADTSTAITVNYHTNENAVASQVYYDIESRSDVSEYQFHAEGFSNSVNDIKRLFHHVELTGLVSDQTYYFVVGDEEVGFSSERKFQTVPATGPIRFVTGGDMGTSLRVKGFLDLAGKQAPHFALIGGDVAYGNGEKKSYSLWRTWLTYWGEEMVTPDGHMIPLAIAIGNHEVNYFAIGIDNRSPWYMKLFAQDDTNRSYFYRHFGENSAVLFLDTDHVHGYSGKQKTWIRDQMGNLSESL